MNPHHNSNQNPATASGVPQVNAITNQQTCNGNVGGLLPNNRPIVAPASFMNFPNQPFPLQNTATQFPNGIVGFNPQQTFNPFPVNQFNPSQQQQAQFFANNPMNRPVFNQNPGVPNQQAIMQNTIQNIYQLLQFQNPNFAQCPPGNIPVFQNQIMNPMNNQNPGFLPNQQFGMPNFNAPLQHANQGQQLPNMGQQFLPHASGLVQIQQQQNLMATQYNLQNQIAQGVVPQNQNFIPNQMVGMPNPNGQMQHANQGQQGFVPPMNMMDVNASRQIGNTGQQGNPGPTVTNFQEKHGNVPANVKNGWVSPRKNFTGDKRNDASHKGFKSQFHHGKHGYNGNMNKESYNNGAVNSSPRNSTKFEKKVPSLKYTDQEIKQWREARKKNFPTNVQKSKKEETLSERRQQLKEILEKQAELGCEVAEIPSYYLHESQEQNPRGEKYEMSRFKKGKFNNKRGSEVQDNRMNKRTRQEKQEYQRNEYNKKKERDPSLLEKLLSRDIKRDKNHLLQVFRFMAVNSFFSGESEKSWKFPQVIVRVASVDVAGEPPCAVVEGGEMAVDQSSDEEEGEITD